MGKRGQIVIPAQARRNHAVNAGDKLLVLGNREDIALILIDALMQAFDACGQLRAGLAAHDNSEEKSL